MWTSAPKVRSPLGCGSPFADPDVSRMLPTAGPRFVLGSPWFSVVLNGSLCSSLVLPDFPLFSLVLLGSPWFSLTPLAFIQIEFGSYSDSFWILYGFYSDSLRIIF
jgi:hypothetical protein